MTSILHFYPTSDHVVAFSTTRRGGCSVGKYASFNVTPYTGDDPKAVHSNLELLCTALASSPDQLILPYQTHGTDIRNIDADFMKKTSEEKKLLLQGIDALITQLPDIIIAVSTADCIPVLLYDTRQRVSAAIHAGWRGTANRIVCKCIQKMTADFHTDTADIKAIIGPGISLDAFEVGDEVYESFNALQFPMEKIAQKNTSTQKWHINLPLSNQWLLEEMGVPATQIFQSHICTYRQHQDYFSARRLGIQSGRILTGIQMLHPQSNK